MTTRRPRGRSKYSLIALVRDHYDTLRDYDTQQIMLSDYLVCLGIPTVAAGVGWWTGARANHVPEVLAAVAILTGLIFSAFSQGFDLRGATSKMNSDAARPTIHLIDQLRANVSYAVLLGIILTAILGCAAMFGDTDKPLPMAPSLVVIFLGTQMLLTIFMVLKRVRAVYVAFESSQTERIP